MSQLTFTPKARAFKLTDSNHDEAMKFIDRYGIFIDGALIEDSYAGIKVRTVFFHNGAYIVIHGKDIMALSETDVGKLMAP